MKIEKLRNTVAVRLRDEDYDQFMANTGRSYSKTLRTLIQKYNQQATKKPQDKERPDAN